MEIEVGPYMPDAWVDPTKTRIGYEVLVARYFYRYVPPRSLQEIDTDIKATEAEIQRLLGEVKE
jgi:type I restriction enzyme M protein